MNVKSVFVKWHRALAWWGAAVAVIWTLSGMAHPLMVWLGPQSQQFFPPSFTLSPDNVSSVPGILNSLTLENAAITRVLPFEDALVLQVTENAHSPRRYYALDTGNEMVDQDQAQAAWLAGFYTGKPASAISAVDFITEFTPQYPAINRLLPVFRVRYEGADSLTAWIYTETNSLSVLTNSTRAFFNRVFTALHTWSWLDWTGTGRVLLIGALILTLFTVATTGFSLILLLKNRPMQNPSRRLHRLAAHVMWLPVMCWSASGFYHLLQFEFEEDISGIRLNEPVRLGESTLSADMGWLADYAGTQLNAFSLVRGPDNEALYRLSIAQHSSAGPVSEQERFAGIAQEQGSHYIDARTGHPSTVNDMTMVRYLATAFTGYEENTLQNTTLVTNFSAAYDFRNKRLPVWQADYPQDGGRRVYIDPVTGILVDQNRSGSRIELWVFSNLHKWNHLTPLMGSLLRDALIILTLLCILLIVVVPGTRLLLQSPRPAKKT